MNREITALYAEGQLIGVRVGGRAYWRPTLNSLARLTSLPIRYDRSNREAGTITWVYPKEVVG